MEDEKVVVKLERHLWPDELKAKKKYNRMKARLIIVCLLLSFSMFLTGILVGNSLRKNSIVKTDNKIVEMESIFKNVWYYANDYDDLDKVLAEKALVGMANFEEDPYTVYMTMDEESNFVSSINMNYVGLGVSIMEDHNQNVYITKLYKNTPAEKSGLMAGDYFISVDGIDCHGIGVTRLQELVLGEIGTDVKVTILRGHEEFTFDITRESFNTAVYGEKFDGYYVLSINSFGETTYRDCLTYLKEMEEAGINDLIIDLRNNTGGYLTAVSDVAGLFLDKGSIVLRQVDKDGNQAIQRVTGTKQDFIEKIVIIQNQMTASASEVLIMALAEQFDNVKIVGTNSLGKGVMQHTYDLSDNSYLKITVAKWLSSKSISINKVGITPDFYVELDNALLITYYDSGEEVFKQGDNSYFISTYQMALQFLGYDLDRTDGYFDESFEKAIRNFQKTNGLEITGQLDSLTESEIAFKVRSLYQTDKDHYDAQYIKAVELINE